jgi:hypothetical protein
MSEKTKYIVFTAGVNAQTIGKLREAVVTAANARFTDLYILISSSGGDVNEGLNIAVKKDPSLQVFFNRIHTVIIEIVLLVLLILGCIKLIDSEWRSFKAQKVQSEPTVQPKH